MLDFSFFNRDTQIVAKDLLGKVIRYRINEWLSAQIIEVEAYYKSDKASHASLGYTERKKALFEPAGTIYMYYARGGHSLNVSCKGKGNAVLIKSGYPYFDKKSPENSTLPILQTNNPSKTKGTRKLDKLCNGQTLLCKSLGITVEQWNCKQFNQDFYFEDVGRLPIIIQTTRLGITVGRDEDRLYRFIDKDRIKYCTKNPLTMEKPPKWKEVSS